MVYEGGATFSAAHIYFKRFHPADLGIPGQTRGGPGNTQQAPLPGRTTPDNTPRPTTPTSPGTPPSNRAGSARP